MKTLFSDGNKGGGYSENKAQYHSANIPNLFIHVCIYEWKFFPCYKVLLKTSCCNSINNNYNYYLL